MKTRSKDKEGDKLPSPRRSIAGASGNKTGKVTKAKETKTKGGATKNITKVIKLPLKDKKNVPDDISGQIQVISIEKIAKRSRRKPKEEATATVTSQGAIGTRSRGKKAPVGEGDKEEVQKKLKRQPKKVEAGEVKEEKIKDKSLNGKADERDKVSVEKKLKRQPRKAKTKDVGEEQVKDKPKRQSRKNKTPIEMVMGEKGVEAPVKRGMRRKKQTSESQVGIRKEYGSNDAPPDVPKEKRVNKRKQNVANEDPVPDKKSTRGKNPEVPQIKVQPLRKKQKVTGDTNKDEDAAEEKEDATQSRKKAKLKETEEPKTSQKLPIEVKVIVHEKAPETSDSEEELSDKENKASESVSINSQPQANTSDEKKPVYKILGSKAKTVPMDQLIVMEDLTAEGSKGVYDFSLSQNGNGDDKKKKKRKPRKRIVMPKKTISKKIWNDKEVKRAKKKVTVTQTKMDKLQSIPAHIREKIKVKETIKKRESLLASTPLRNVQKMDIANVISPIVTSITESDTRETSDSETHEVDNAMDDSTSVEDSTRQITKTDSPRKDDVQPWRTDEANPLPMTSHIRHSDHDFLPTFSSDVIVKATPKKPKPPPRTSQAKSNDPDHSDPGPSYLAEKTYRISPTSKSAEAITIDQNAPEKQQSIYDYTLENFFGFETENSIEVNEEIVQKHGEDALRKERERLKALVPAKKKQSAKVYFSPPRRAKRIQQLTIKEAIPSTSRQPPKETPDNDIFEPEKPKPRKSYSRPKVQKIASDSDESDVEEPPQTVEEEGEEIMKKYQKKKKPMPKAKVGTKELEQQKQLEEFCTSFNEMCDEVDQFEMLVE